MSYVTYASFRQKPPDDGFDVSAIAGSADNVERNFYIQYHNRIGRSLLSNKKTLVGAGTRVTLNSSLILEGEEVFWIVGSCETSGNETDAKIIFIYQVRESNQQTRRSLPATIDLTQNIQYEGVFGVTDTEQLKLTSTANFLDGQLAYVADSGIFYRYDSEAYTDPLQRLFSYGAYAKGLLGTNWIEWSGGDRAYIDSTVDLKGGDLRLETTESAETLPIPPKVGAGDSTPLRYWINNGLKADGGSSITASNGRYTLDISVDGIEGYSSLFANKFKYYLRGYVNRATGILDPSIETVDELKTWNPTNDLIVLPEDLPRNHAAVYDLILSFDNDNLIGFLPGQTPEIEVLIVEVPNTQSNLTEVANIIGDLVFSDREKLLIVPGERRLAGIASVKVPGSSQGFTIDTYSEQPIIGLLANRANQLAVIAGSLNGQVTIKQQAEALDYAEKIRAYISTESGLSNLALASSEITIVNTGITITITHPVTDNSNGIIRSNYPDRYLSNNADGDFTPTQGYIFLKDVVNDIVYQSELLSVGAIASQSFEYSNLDSFTTINSLPIQSDPAFSLFEPEAIALSSNNTGTLNSTFIAYFAYFYDTDNIKATKIRHDLAGVIPTATLAIGEVISELAAAVEHRRDLGNPHLITTDKIGAATQVDMDIANTNITDNRNDINTNIADINIINAEIATYGTAATGNLGLNGNDVIVLDRNSDSDERGVIPAVPIKSIVENTDFTATPNVLTKVDTTNGSITGTIPDSVLLNDWFWFIDLKGSDKASPSGFGNNAFFVNPNGKTTQGFSGVIEVDTENAVVKLQYDGLSNLNVVGGQI